MKMVHIIINIDGNPVFYNKGNTERSQFITSNIIHKQ